jgi:D-glycero-D-manno-heptose 1,7-bisphosphate phosphatase
MLLYCDNYWPIDFEKMWEKYTKSNAMALVTVYKNNDNYTKNNLRIGDEDLIEVYDKTRNEPNLKGVDIGFFILRNELIDLIPEGNFNFEKIIIPKLIIDRQIIAYPTEHRYYSVGSHERLKLTEEFLENRKFIILDRDGVINKKAPKSTYVTKWLEWEWIKGSKEAIVKLKKAGFKIIIVTNQAGIARGIMTSADLELIHTKMILELKEFGGGIDKIYYCPHSWNDNCECRKPKPGMLFEAQREFHLNLNNTWFVGDDERDELAGKAAGMKTFLINGDNGLLNFVNTQILDSVESY